MPVVGITTTQLLIAVAIGVVVIGGGVLWLRSRRKNPAQQQRHEVRAQWNKIEGLLNHRQEMNYKLAVIQANSLLDSQLRELGVGGKTAAERLQRATYRYPRLKKVWWVQKMCFRLEADKRFHLRFTVARKVLKQFHQALKDIGAL